LSSGELNPIGINDWFYKILSNNRRHPMLCIPRNWALVDYRRYP
jgi:hypothetical protein